MFCSLEDDASVAKSQVRMSVVGGDEPRSRLVKVAPGQWAWEACGAGSGCTTAALATPRLPGLKAEALGESFAQGCRLHRGQGLTARSHSNVPDLEDMAFSKVRPGSHIHASLSPLFLLLEATFSWKWSYNIQGVYVRPPSATVLRAHPSVAILYLLLKAV